jgi:hypothetical protein
MQLERETLEKMAACFGGRFCRRCGKPAERLSHGRFYCDRHYPRIAFPQGESIPKVYRCRPFAYK